MSILNAGVGFVILMAGRPAYAFFVGGVSLILGSFLTERLYVAPSEWDALMLPLLFAAFGVLAAFVFRRWAARSAGFIAGVFLMAYLPAALGGPEGWGSGFLIVLAGIVCVVLSFFWFDVTLTFLSCLTGVTLIIQSVHFGSVDDVSMFILLMIFGLITQYLLLQYGKPSPD